MRRQVFFVDFEDGNFTRSPAWQIVSGEFRIESGIGLRSDVFARTVISGSSGDAGKDLAAALLGSIINQAANRSGGSSSSGTTGSATRAEIRTPLNVGNSFAVELELRAAGAEGRIEFAVYQGQIPEAGYILAYNIARKPSLELTRFSNFGSGSVGASYARLKLEDNAPHRVSWSRDGTGQMVVSVDGTEAIRATDTALRDGFDGLAIINRSGVFAVREISVWGEP